MSNLNFQASVIWAIRAAGESGTCDEDGTTVWAFDPHADGLRYGVVQTGRGFRVVNSLRETEHGLYPSATAAAHKAVEFLKFHRAFHKALGRTGGCTKAALREAAAA